MAKKRLDEIQYARAFALFAVLFVHTTSTGVGYTPHDSIMFHIYNFFNIAGKLGTPTFIFLSSFILFYTYYDKPLNKQLLSRFYSNRLTYILLPYFVFSLIYWLVKGYMFGMGDFGSEIKRFLMLLATGKAHAHLYFVFISVQFYIMFPLFMYLFKKYSFVRKYSIIHGVVLQWLWVYLNAEYFKIELKGSISLSYMMNYFIGAFFGIYYNQIIEWVRDWKKSASVLSIILIGYGGLVSFYVGIMYITRIGVMKFPNMVYEFAWSTHALFAGLVIFMLSHYTEIKFPDKVKFFLERMGAVSFGIYLVHPLILLIAREIMTTGSPIVFHGWQLITYILVFMGSWLIVRLAYNYLPYSWVLFGKDSPKKPKNIG